MKIQWSESVTADYFEVRVLIRCVKKYLELDRIIEEFVRVANSRSPRPLSGDAAAAVYKIQREYNDDCWKLGINEPLQLVNDFGGFTEYFRIFLCRSIRGSIPESFEVIPPLRKVSES
jgi:hypothetical protein